MKILKTSLAAISLLCLGFAASAQLKIPISNNDLRTNLQKVISDFPSGLSSIKGDVLVQNPQTIEYATLLDFEGAEENSITLYSSPKSIYSWQAIILTTENFEEAEKKYKWLCSQLKIMTINSAGGYSFSLNGDYNEPAEGKKFSSSIFHLTPAATLLPKFQVEAAIQFYFPEWKISLTVYQKEREDNERGNTRDE